MPTDPCREAFEAWFIRECGPDPAMAEVASGVLSVRKGDGYYSINVNHDWKLWKSGWQAAWQARGDHDAAEHAATVGRILDERK